MDRRQRKSEAPVFGHVWTSDRPIEYRFLLEFRDLSHFLRGPFKVVNKRFGQFVSIRSMGSESGWEASSFPQYPRTHDRLLPNFCQQDAIQQLSRRLCERNEDVGGLGLMGSNHPVFLGNEMGFCKKKRTRDRWTGWEG